MAHPRPGPDGHADQGDHSPGGPQPQAGTRARRGGGDVPLPIKRTRAASGVAGCRMDGGCRNRCQAAAAASIRRLRRQSRPGTPVHRVGVSWASTSAPAKAPERFQEGGPTSRPPSPEAVDRPGHPPEQGRPLARRILAGESLERIPKGKIARRGAVDREVAFKHAPMGSEAFNHRFDVGPPLLGENFRTRRLGRALEAEAEDRHAESADLDEQVGVPGELANSTPPSREDLLLPCSIGTYSDRRRRMV